MRFVSRRLRKKTSLCTVHVMKLYGITEVQIHPLLNSALDGGEWFDDSAALLWGKNSLYCTIKQVAVRTALRKFVMRSICICMFVFVCVCVCIYIYIYIYMIMTIVLESDL